MKVAYIRVSSKEQNEERQVEALKDYGIDRHFVEKVSGKNMERPKLLEMLDFVREGDVVYVSELSRLGRSVTDLITITDRLKNKGVGFVSCKEKFDTGSPYGDMIFKIFAVMAEFERNVIKERQAEGIILAKARGKYKGRKVVGLPVGFAEVYSHWKGRGLTAVEAMERLGLKKSTFYKLVREYEKRISERATE